MSSEFHFDVLSKLTQLVREAQREINPPKIQNLTLELDVKVVKLEKSQNSFDFWVKLSTLEKGHPIYLPIKLHKNAQKLLYEGELKGIVRIKKRADGRWFLSFVIEKKVAKGKKRSKNKVAVDLGVRALVVTNTGIEFGAENYEKLKSEIKKLTEYARRRQKLEAILKKKRKDEEFRLSNKRYKHLQGSLTAWRKNEIGRALNALLAALTGLIVVIEDLELTGSTKSKVVNRILNRGLLRYLNEKLIYKMGERGIVYELVNPAYTSQLCPRCGWVGRENRRDQEHFHCVICEYEANADQNAALNILRRSWDSEINSISDHRKIKELLKRRFYDAHSVSSWLDLDAFLAMSWKEFREALNRQSATLKPS